MDRSSPDLALVDTLARLQLQARRAGFCVQQWNPPAELRGLVELLGLAEALALEPRREVELGEALGPDEVVQPGDPSV